MERDMDLVRKILFALEDSADTGLIKNLPIQDYDLQAVAYHCNMMHGFGLVTKYIPIEADCGLFGF